MIKCKFYNENEHKQQKNLARLFFNKNWSINMSDFSGVIRDNKIRALTLDFEYLEYHDYLKLNH